MVFNHEKNPDTYRWAVVEWTENDGICRAITKELRFFGQHVETFRYDKPFPNDVDIIFTFAPYGRLCQIIRQVENLPVNSRPIYIHWNFESLPNPLLPRPFVRNMGITISKAHEMRNIPSPASRFMVSIPPVFTLANRLHKYRYFGDYFRAFRQHLLDYLFDTSQIFSQYYCQSGLPARFVPWGTSPDWFANLHLQRDIDVLWIGKRRSKRRSRIIDQVRSQLTSAGFQVVVIDGIENPMIYGEQRTRLLNRARMTLNVLPTWYDPAFTFRFHVAAGNKSLVITEEHLQHCPSYEAGKHFASSAPENLVETIKHYLNHEDERRELADNAYDLVTTQMTLGNSVRQIMNSINPGNLARRK